MNCPNCSQTVEAGAAYCGNCGQPLQKSRPLARFRNRGSQPPAQIALAPAGAPAYTLPVAAQQLGEMRAMVSVLLGITGIVGGLFMAIFGLLLGVSGLIAGTWARTTYRRGLSMAGLIFSSLAILVGLAVWIYAVQHDPRFNQGASKTGHSRSTTPAVAADNLNTPCYSAGFIDELNVTNSPDSCDMNAYNGQTLSSSTNAYKVYADTTQIASANNFMTLAKQALEKDVRQNLAGFEVDNQRVGSFAGAPAYIINASDRANNVTVVEAAVMRQVSNGQNVFILVHAASGTATDLDILESEWQWK